MNYCCKPMKFFIEHPRDVTKPGSVLKQYDIEVTGLSLLEYCPWCGVKLDEQQRSAWFDFLRTEYAAEGKRKLPKILRVDP